VDGILEGDILSEGGGRFLALKGRGTLSRTQRHLLFSEKKRKEGIEKGGGGGCVGGGGGGGGGGVGGGGV